MMGLAFALMLQAAPMPVSPPTAPDLTVTARKDKRRVSGVIRSLVAEAGGSRLTRFEDGICPGVLGGSPAFGKTMVRLVRENMASAGAKLEEEGCRVTALVVFTSNPAYTVRSMFDGEIGVSRSMDRFRRDRLLDSDDAIRSLHLSRTAAINGGAMDAEINAPPRVRNALPSRIKPTSRQEAFFAMAIIDTAAAPGRTVRQLADVATMHLLLDLQPDAAEKAQGSILTVFADPPEKAPTEMTALDRGMLKGLYGAPTNDHHGYAQRGRMAIAVRAEQAVEDAADR